MSRQTALLTQAAPELEAREAASAGHSLIAEPPIVACIAEGCANSGARRRLGGHEFGIYCRPHYHEFLRRFVLDAYQEMVARWPFVGQMGR